MSFMKRTPRANFNGKPKSDEGLSISLANLRIGTYGFGSSSSNALSQTNAIHETGHNNSQPGPSALYPDSMWTSDYFPRGIDMQYTYITV